MNRRINKITTRLLYLATISLLCGGCGRAPSVDILGSFFPVWMVCLTIAVIMACGLRLVLLRYRLESEIGPVALFYPSVVILLTSLLWLIFFR
jgi:YtcA family